MPTLCETSLAYVQPRLITVFTILRRVRESAEGALFVAQSHTSEKAAMTSPHTCTKTGRPKRLSMNVGGLDHRPRAQNIVLFNDVNHTVPVLPEMPRTARNGPLPHGFPKKRRVSERAVEVIGLGNVCSSTELTG